MGYENRGEEDNEKIEKVSSIRRYENYTEEKEKTHTTDCSR